MRLAALKREEELVREEAERLALEKQRHVRALKRLRDEVSRDWQLRQSGT
jgi:hypothetical protein